ncbi:hypothetical protein FOA52_000525 [Chlamydomonas sp. UWO 241]|nr:hypothetical protein FOA52_000525 [Chlamydomonas sp. UWO 241]
MQKAGGGVSLEASALRVSLLLELLPEGRGQAVVVTGVLEGSEADKAGIVPGQKLLAVSDPIRPGEMWSCGDRPSLRFVKDTFTATRNKTIQIELSAKPLFTAASLVAPPPPSSSSLSSMGSLSSMSDGEGDAPATNGPRPKSDVQKRIERRKDYMEVVDQRDDRGFVTIAALLFLGPAVAILTWAYFSGYLDSMYMNSLTTSQ